MKRNKHETDFLSEKRKLIEMLKVKTSLDLDSTDDCLPSHCSVFFSFVFVRYEIFLVKSQVSELSFFRSLR
jgi:hypothetical protein